MKRFPVLTWSPLCTHYVWQLVDVATLPSLIDGLCLYLARAHG
jgi:hypothetical protein